MSENYEELFRVDEHLKCKNCGHTGAVMPYGRYYPAGVAKAHPDLAKYFGMEKMSLYGAIGGTHAWECTNCKAIGLEDGAYEVEGLKITFERV